MNNNIINIIGIKCKYKYYISEYISKYNNYKSIKHLIVNGKKPNSSFHPDWNIVNKKPMIIQELISQPDINYRYELIDKTLKSKKMPLILLREKVAEYNENDCCYFWKKEYKIYQSLYELKADKVPPILKDIKFIYTTVMEINNIKNYKEIFNDKVKHKLIDKILYPNIILPMKFSFLTTEQSYDIIRQYIKQNINYEVATITSDYDFCFTVKKKIRLTETEEYTIDINNSLKRKNKHITKYRTYREIECFNMAPKKYEKYNVISGFQGEDQKELKKNIDTYCKNLIEMINKPLVDCPHCKGMGVILDENLPIDKL